MLLSVALMPVFEKAMARMTPANPLVVTMIQI
jgi:hypothetical protein